MKDFFISNSIVSKVTVLNCVFFLIFTFVLLNGWLFLPFQSDPTFVCMLITALMSWATFITYKRAVELDKIIIDPKLITVNVNNSNALTAYFSAKLIDLQHLSSTAVYLGILGTVLGVIIALHGITPEMIVNLAAMLGAVGTVLKGVATAFYTTLVGSIAGIWIDYNISILNKNYTVLYSNVVGNG